MKTTIVCALMALSSVSLAALSPLKFIEKSSYKLSALTKQGTADKSFLTDTNKVTVTVSAQGGVVTLFSPSKNDQVPNSLTMTFDPAGKMTDAKTQFTAANTTKAIFPKANADVVLDVGPEYIIDHLAASPDHPFVAEHTKGIIFTGTDKGIDMDILLDDSRIYRVSMDVDGRLISKGMKK